VTISCLQKSFSSSFRQPSPFSKALSYTAAPTAFQRPCVIYWSHFTLLAISALLLVFFLWLLLESNLFYYVARNRYKPRKNGKPQHLAWDSDFHVKLPGSWLALQIHLITAQLRRFSIVYLLEYFSSLRCIKLGLKIVSKNVGSWPNLHSAVRPKIL
jgi:hypothetical protein